MKSKRERTPSQTANIFASIAVSLIIVLAGVLMILSGVNAINIDIKYFWLPTLLCTLFACGLVIGVFRKETTPLWFGIVSLVCAVPVVINLTADTAYSVIYPIFIAAPAVASLITVAFADNKKLHLQGIILFGGLALIFLLQSLSLINNWFVIAGIAVVMVGLFFFVAVATSRRGRWDDGDRPQRPRGKRWDDGDRPQRRNEDNTNQDK